MKRQWIWRGIRFAAVMALGVLAFGFAVMALWNYLVPDLFNGPSIKFGQALGLLVLSRLLLTGFRPWGWGYGKGGSWRKNWEQRLAAMSPEEREKFRQAYNRKCGGWYRTQAQPETTVVSQEPAEVNSR